MADAIYDSASILDYIVTRLQAEPRESLGIHGIATIHQREHSPRQVIPRARHS